jgi:SPFH domain / Band 7 family
VRMTPIQGSKAIFAGFVSFILAMMVVLMATRLIYWPIVAQYDAPDLLKQVGMVFVVAAIVGTAFIFNLFGIVFIVNIGHIGLLITLGERRSDNFLKEGIVWLPPFTWFEEFEARERDFTISSDMILSKDSVSIKLKGQLRVRTINPYKFSDITSPDKTIQEEAISSIRSHISNISALEVACSANLQTDLMNSLRAKADNLGLIIASLSIIELQLPSDIEKYAQVISIIRNKHPEISFREALDSVQSNQTQVNKHIIESTTLGEAANAVFTKIIRGTTLDN